MRKNTLAKDIEKAIQNLEDLKIKHNIDADPLRPINSLDKAIMLLYDFRIDVIIDEVVDGK